MNKLLRPLSRFRKHQPDIDALSEHIDGRLDASRAAAVESHISTCEACREAHASLLETRALLAAMPDVSHPRSFRLREADIEAPVNRPARSRSAPMRWAPACAAVSAVVFVVVLGADLASRDANNTAQFSSLESGEPVGMTAADDSADGAGSAGVDSAAPESAPGTPVTARSSAEYFETNPAPQPEGAATRDSSAPTGPPPDGDAPIEGEAGAQPDADATAAANAGGSNFVPPTATPAALGAVPPDAVPAVTGTDADGELVAQIDSDDGNRNAFRVVEITAAAIAVLAGAAYVAWRWMQRGNAA